MTLVCKPTPQPLEIVQIMWTIKLVNALTTVVQQNITLMFQMESSIATPLVKLLLLL